MEFLYTDKLSSLNNKEQDQLFKLVILADHLFISRLKEQCELLLVRCMNLKNTAQFLNFAHIYNAQKLKFSCFQFIISNMAPLLEARAFDDLDETLLKELSKMYFDQKRHIECRFITPYSTAPSEEEILSVTSAFPISLTEVVAEKIQNKSVKRRPRGHKIHVTDSSQNNKKEEVDCDHENVIQFPDEPFIGNETVSNRLRAIKLATEKIELEDNRSVFTKLGGRSDEGVLGSSYEEFPVLNSPPNFNKSSNKVPEGSSRHRIVKMSQKQRKRLSSETNSDGPIVHSPGWLTVVSLIV